MQEQGNKIIWAIDPIHTKIRFEAKYLMITSVSGWFREFEGTVVTSDDNFNDSDIRLTLYTHSLFTGVDERDNHLRSSDFFDAKKYPAIYFKSTAVTVQGDSIQITGILSIKDVTKEISFTADYLGRVNDPSGNIKTGFELDIIFDRKDFNITWNQYFDKQGVLIADRVKVHCDVQLLKLS